MSRRNLKAVKWRTFSAAVVILLGMLIVWRQAQRISIDGRSLFATPSHRAYLIAALFAIVILICCVRWLARTVGRARIVWDQADSEDGSGNQLDPGDHKRDGKDAQLRLARSFAAALKVVRRGGPAWRMGRYSPYRLPWYLVLGTHNSGKSALLDASGLTFWHNQMVVEAQDTEGMYRWWFADEAVLLEASAFDASRDGVLDNLLSALRRNRRCCPINGLIVTINVCTLLDEHNVKNRASVAALRESVDAMYRKFGVRFPIYIVLTHCDLLPGFDAFFNGLSPEERAQVWGVTFESDEKGGRREFPGSVFQDEFDSLIRQLQVRVVDRMPIRSDPDRSAAIYGFPIGFGALGESLTRLLNDAFGVSPYAEHALLRGVYFTAARSVAAQAVSSFKGHNRGHFIAQLLRDVMFRDAGLAGRRNRLSSRPGLRFAIGAAIVMFAAAFAAGMFVCYERNLGFLARSGQAVNEFSRLARQDIVTGDAISALPVLNVAGDLAGESVDGKAPVPFLARTGLYQGMRIGTVARARYQMLLKATVQPFIVGQWAAALRSGSILEPSERYGLLRAYLMLGDKAHYDRGTVLARAKDDLDEIALTDAQRADLTRHINALFGVTLAADVPLDAALIAQTRNALVRLPTGERLFESIRTRLEMAMPEPLSVLKMAGVDAPDVMRRKSGQPLSEGVPGAYTPEGYRLYSAMRDAALKSATKQGWVLGMSGGSVDNATRDEISADMDRCYFDRYIAVWDALIQDVTLLPLPNSESGAAIAGLLSGQDSPLRLFLQAAAKGTTLVHERDTLTRHADAHRGTVDALKRRIRLIFGAGSANSSQPASAPSAATVFASDAPTEVDVHFAALHRLVESGGQGAAPPIDEVLIRLSDLAAFLDASNVAHARGLPSPPADAIDHLRQTARHLPEPLSGMLVGLSDSSTATVLEDEHSRLNDAWRADVAPFCHAALDQRYPFNPRSGIDVTLDDFTRLFRPGGLIDSFFQANLLQYVDTTTTPWTWKKNATKLRMSADVLQQFARATQIRDAFFPDGDKAMSVPFTITPRSMDPALTRFELNLQGQDLTYMHDPHRTTSFEWPEASGEQTARIDYAPSGKDGRGGFQTDGPWALFRLLDKGVVQMREPDDYVVDFDLGGREVELELNAASVINPFALVSLHQFSCLDQL